MTNLDIILIIVLVGLLIFMRIANRKLKDKSILLENSVNSGKQRITDHMYKEFKEIRKYGVNYFENMSDEEIKLFIEKNANHLELKFETREQAIVDLVLYAETYNQEEFDKWFAEEIRKRENKEES
ncbi:hypothetical protein BK126_26480 [Paenibacillus sp. FSL H7-0326]|uniref:hypothetical protein n=1 Tax=Paenibacillus sp. FSL H7-0326 TaxID=1921144 RepID=UPI00096D9A04|nr:hypothetical protein [Paenibacillus sp. FSL H7-0326]OMC63742.1 hypothetical protein BK126_26480 [Paenibacillus sp. FSL H7-0326]